MKGDNITGLISEIVLMFVAACFVQQKQRDRIQFRLTINFKEELVISKESVFIYIKLSLNKP
jgi:hypothetical protein